MKNNDELLKKTENENEIHRKGFTEHIGPVEKQAYVDLIASFLKWTVISLICGGLTGVVGALFGKALEFATEFRTEHRYIIFFLPFAGVLLIFLYSAAKMQNDRGTNTIILAARRKADVNFVTAPLIFAATFITHLFGGSAGREGAALQIGGSLVSPLGRLFRLDKKDMSILVMCGMSAGFSSLFGTPAAAAVFAQEVTIVGTLHYGALVPCMISAVTAAMVARFLGAEAESFIVSGAPELEIESLPQLGVIVIIGAVCAAVSVLFCEVMHKAGGMYARYIPNRYLRVAAGGTIIVILTVLLGTTDYNGAGMDVIKRAFAGEADPLAFLIKIVFTALTLGCGFKGGEIVPSFFVGSTLGCTLGSLMGLDPSFGAAAGLIAVFCGVTNCPLASLILSAELFGLSGMPFYAVVIAVSYMLSGYSGLYSAQKFSQSKFRTSKSVSRSLPSEE